jgi:cytochrome c biogenesis protein CcdA
MESFIMSEKAGKLELRTKKAKRIFLVTNLLLILGVLLVVSTLLYLLFNLNQSDRVIYKCIFTIISGLVLVIFYVIGFNAIKKKQDSRRQYL